MRREREQQTGKEGAADWTEPEKRSAASSALLLDKPRQTVAWKHPPLSLFTKK